VSSSGELRLAHYYPRAVAGDGGCSYAVRGWAAACARLGADVVVGYEAPGKAAADGSVRWQRIEHVGRGALRAPADLAVVLEGRDFLILHSGWVLHNVRAAETARRRGIAYVVTPHGAYDPHVLARRRLAKRAWWALLERGLVTGAAAVHVFFEEERAFVRRLGFRGPVVVVPSGVTIPDDVDGTVSHEPYVLWMGRFDVHTKGLDLLLRALASMPAHERPAVRLHGPDWRGGKAVTAELVRRLGLQRWVSINPAIYGADKWSMLSGASLFAFPSRWEAQGISVLEAAGSGAAVVATTTTFVGRELAREGAAIGSDATPASLAAAIRRGWTTDTSEVRRTAAALVRERYAWPAVGARFLDELRSIR
jgi:glycosyltransferase involved in cell wall biosynthesis